MTEDFEEAIDAPYVRQGGCGQGWLPPDQMKALRYAYDASYGRSAGLVTVLEAGGEALTRRATSRGVLRQEVIGWGIILGPGFAAALLLLLSIVIIALPAL